MTLRLMIVVTALCLSARPASAETVQPDRPGLATGTYTVNPGQLIAEAGIQTDFRRDGDRPTSWSIPQITLRGGLTDKLEWDIIWNGAALTDARGESSDWSVTDVAIGGKYSFYESDGWNVSALALVSLPAGTSPSSSDNVDPLIGLLWDTSLSETVALFGVIQSSSFEAEEGRIHDIQLAVGANFTLTEQLATFVEVFASKPYGDEPSTALIDAGITYLPASHIQLDVSAGLALNSDTEHFVGAGIAILF